MITNIRALRRLEREAFAAAEQAYADLAEAIEALAMAEIQLEAIEAVPVAALENGTIWMLVQNRRDGRRGAPCPMPEKTRLKWLALSGAEALDLADERDATIADYEAYEGASTDE